MAISYDSPEVLATFSVARGITFPLLSDRGSATIKAYGILNTLADLDAFEAALGPEGKEAARLAEALKGGRGQTGSLYGTRAYAPEFYRGIPFPGTFIVDRQGRVTSRFFEDYYKERNTVASMLLSLGGGAAPVQATRISTNHLELTTYPSDAVVARANRFSLAVEIKPRPGMHVYAPGAAGYRIISLKLAPQPFVRLLPLTYPKSEIYDFKALNERVPVYQKPFVLLQPLVLDDDPSPDAKASLKTDRFRLTGTLEYQACDDKICFNPVSIPLAWTIAIKPNVDGLPAGPP